MTAIAILFVAGVLAWLYTRYLGKQSGEVMMGMGVLLLIPYAVIFIGTIVALVMLT